MMRFNNIKMLAAAVMASACAFVSCVEMEQQESAVGYLDAPSLEVDVAIEDMTQTKAPDIVISAPSPSEIHYVVKDKDGNVKYDEDGLWTEPLVLPTGAYTVDATYGSNGFGAAYFTGTVSGTIAPLDKDMPALTLSLANSLLCIEVDPEFASHFDVGSSKAVLKSGSSSADVSYGEWIYVPSGADLEVTMSGTTAGKPVSLTHTLSNPSPKAAYNVVCKKSSTSWPSITWSLTQLADGAFEGGLYFEPAIASNMSDANVASLIYQVKGGLYDDWTDVSVSDVNGYKYISGLSNDVTYSLRARVGNIVSEELSFAPVSFQSCFSVESVTAEHNNNGNADVELSSTTMTAGNMKVNLPAIIAGMATVKASGSFSSSTNAAAGSFSDVTLTSTAENVSFANVSDWPYLPQGTYTATVSATCTLNSATYTASSTAAPKVPAPVFKVTLSAYTSYDKYAATNGISKSITDANNCDPSTLYNAGAAWSISEDLMKNPNYSKTIAIYIDDDAPGRISTVTTWDYNCFYQNVSGLSWAPHTHQVELTFDNKTISSVKNTHHITGLPHRSSPPKSTDADPVNGWTEGNGNAHKWESGYLQLGVSGGQQEHTVYKDFHIPADIDVSLASKIAAHNAPVNTTCSVLIGSTTVLSVYSDGGAFNYKTTEKEETVLTKMNSSSERITLKNSYSVTSSWGRVYYVNVLYR